jgi:hypothetical protein
VKAVVSQDEKLRGEITSVPVAEPAYRASSTVAET